MRTKKWCRSWFCSTRWPTKKATYLARESCLIGMGFTEEQAAALVFQNDYGRDCKGAIRKALKLKGYCVPE